MIVLATFKQMEDKNRIQEFLSLAVGCQGLLSSSLLKLFIMLLVNLYCPCP